MRYVDPTGHDAIQESEAGRFLNDALRTGFGYVKGVVKRAGEGIVGAGVTLARATQNLQKPENLSGMFKGRSGPGAGVLVEQGATGPFGPFNVLKRTTVDPPRTYAVGERLPDGRIAGESLGAARRGGSEFSSGAARRGHRFNLLSPRAKGPTAKPLKEWLTEQPELLAEARRQYRSSPEWQGIDPDTAPAFHRPKAPADRIRALSGESGGHHPHGLALGGKRGQKLTTTGETRQVKNPRHREATKLQIRMLRAIKKQR